MDLLLQNFLNWEIIKATAPFLLQGLGMSLLLCLAAIPIGAAGGLALALLYGLHRRWLTLLLIVWIDFFRAVPPLVLLIFIHFGLPFAGVKPPAFVSAMLAFLLNTSSYFGEIFRAGIESVPRGQWEAARSTGLTRGQTLAYVIVPQATRNVLPDLVSNTLEVVKLTSIASVIALPELLYAARSAQSVTYNASPIVAAAVIYVVLLWPVVRLLSRMEHRMLGAR
ncbi:MAG: amino acid ABC transporter permease [Alphaproteobacteria bacterium]|nr:amino acid ABC transporter permease [Alphaproteobacteria bacterium]